MTPDYTPENIAKAIEDAKALGATVMLLHFLDNNGPRVEVWAEMPKHEALPTVTNFA